MTHAESTELSLSVQRNMQGISIRGFVVQYFHVQYDLTYTTNLKYYDCIQFHDGHRVKALSLLCLSLIKQL